MTQEAGRSYEWDDFHLLVRAGAASGSDAQAFQYDAFGRLVAVRRGTSGWPIEEELSWDGSQMAAAFSASQSLAWSALWRPGLDSLISVKLASSSTEALALNDGRGSVSGYLLADGPSQGLWLSSSFSPEGRASHTDWLAPGSSCSESGTSRCPRPGGMPFGFHSAYTSPAHGLLYFRNRWYSSQAGQWLSQDPLGEVDSANLYAFNRFDSVNFVDPLGLSAKGAARAAMPAECAGGKMGGASGRTTCAGAVGPWLQRELDEQQREAERQQVATQMAAAPVPIPLPPGPPPGPTPGPKNLDKFAPKPPKPPGGFGPRELAKKAVEKLGTGAAIRVGLRSIAVVRTALDIIEVGEAVGTPLIGIVGQQMAPEPAGSPGPDSVVPEKPKPDHPASEPGVPKLVNEAEENWENEGGTTRTPDDRPREITRDRPGIRGPPSTDVVQITPNGDAVRIRRYDENGNAIACSTRSRSPIPRQPDRAFHGKPITRSTGSRSPVPREADRPFHGKSIT